MPIFEVDINDEMILFTKTAQIFLSLSVRVKVKVRLLGFFSVNYLAILIFLCKS